MIRFNIVLADEDEAYIESLGRYISSVYPSKFNVTVFTKKDSLEKFLSRKEQYDILLITSDLYSSSVHNSNNGAVIILTDGKDTSFDNDKSLHCINKYQPGEAIIAGIVEYYSAFNDSIEKIISGDKNTLVITVFSPQGGSGKTVISMGLAALLTQKGLKVLHLSFESVPSMECFINQDEGKNGLSGLIFYLKERKKNLSFKIDTSISYSDDMGINFIPPVQCSLDLDELNSDDVAVLLAGVRSLSKFDTVIIDTDSVLNSRNISLMDESNYVVMPLLQGALTEVKLEMMRRIIKLLKNDNEQVLFEKVIPIINKYNQRSTEKEIIINGSAVKIKIPYLNDLFIKDAKNCKFSCNGRFAGFMEEVLSDICRKTNLKR